jgi:hypothetical protein
MFLHFLGLQVNAELMLTTLVTSTCSAFIVHRSERPHIRTYLAYVIFTDVTASLDKNSFFITNYYASGILYVYYS